MHKSSIYTSAWNTKNLERSENYKLVFFLLFLFRCRDLASESRFYFNFNQYFPNGFIYLIYFAYRFHRIPVNSELNKFWIKISIKYYMLKFEKISRSRNSNYFTPRKLHVAIVFDVSIFHKWTDNFYYILPTRSMGWW